MEFEVRATVTYRIQADSAEEAEAIARDNASGCDVDGVSIDSVEEI